MWCARTCRRASASPRGPQHQHPPHRLGGGGDRAARRHDICAAISPYRAVRNEVRAMVGSDHFVEVFVDTPIEVCEQRDYKGMYAKARRGEIKGFTGIDDPYEAPEHPEITLDTVNKTPEENAHKIIQYLLKQGLLRPNGN
jgi:sulfate adenylyltransferase